MNHEQFGMPHSRRISDRAQARTRSDAKSPAVAPEIGSARLTRKGAHRRGFTLVELLVVLVIIGLLAAMSMAALFGTLSIARRAATRSLIEKVNAGLEDRLRSLNNRAVVVLPVDFWMANYDPIRAQVIAKKRLMKEEFPQWFTFQLDGGDLYLVGDWDPIYAGNHNGKKYQNPSQVSPVARSYRTWVENAAVRRGVDSNADDYVNVRDTADAHDPRTTSAECLYLIITRGPGTSEINEDSFTESEVGDTDGDGLLEFIDGFGNPLRFYRWPTHYRSPLQKGMAPYDTRFRPEPSERREDDSMDPNRTLIGHWPPAGGTGTTVFRSLARSASPRVIARAAGQLMPGKGVSPWPAFHEVLEPCEYFNPAQRIFVNAKAGYRWNAAFVPDADKTNAESCPQDYFRAYRTTPLIISAGADQSFGLIDVMDYDENGAIDPQSWFMFLQARIMADQSGSVFRSLDADGTHLDNLTNHQQLGGS